MITNSHIRTIILENFNHIGLNRRYTTNNLFLNSYSRNDSEEGAICTFISDATSPKKVLRQYRSSETNEKFIKRIIQLNELTKENSLVNFCIPSVHTIEDNTLVVDSYISGNQVYKSLRTPSFTATKKYRLIIEAFKIAKNMSEIKIKEASDLTIVHGDFVPSNMIFDTKSKQIKVFDWEYWDIQPSSFNYFDLLTSIDSLIQFSPIKPRKPEYRLNFLLNTNSTTYNLLKKSDFYDTQTSFKCKNDLPLLFEEYLNWKKQRQKVLFGSSSNFDRSWVKIIQLYSQIPKNEKVKLWRRYEFLL